MQAPADEKGVSAPAPRARVALVLLLLINLFNYIDRSILSAVLPRIGETLPDDSTRDTRLGWLATAFLLSYMFASPIFGWLADRFSRWSLIGCGVIIWSLASGESGRADVYSTLLLTRIFVGIGEAAYGPAAPTIISDLFPIEKRGQVMAWFYMAIPVGSAIGYLWGGYWDGRGMWQWAFYSVVLPGLLLGAFCFLMIDPRKLVRTSAVAGEKPKTGIPDLQTPTNVLNYAGPGAVKKQRAGMSDYLQLLKTPSYVLNCLGMAALTFAIGGISYWMPTYISKFRQVGTLESVNHTFGLLTVLTGITATLLGGIVGDRLRGRIRGAYFMVSGFGLMAAFPFFLLMLYTPFPLAWVWLAIAEFCLFFNTGPSNTALANVAHPSVRASAFALNILIIHALGDAISPTIIGAMNDHFDKDMNPGFLLVGAMMLVGAAFWILGARFLDRDTALACAPYPEPDRVTSSQAD